MKKSMTPNELKKLADKLEYYDRCFLNSYGLRNINGGFCEVNMFDFDEEYINITVRCGACCGESPITEEQFKLDRKTLEIV